MTEPLTPPLALDRDIAAPMFARDLGTGERVPDAVATAVETALDYAAGQAGALAALDGAVRTDPTLSPSARALRLREAAQKAGERAATKLDAARAGLADAIAELEHKVAAPPLNPALASLEPELRQALRGMAPASREAAVSQALAHGDLVTLGAILRAPPLCSALDGERFGMLRAEFGARFYPDETARLARLRRGLAGLDAAIGAFGRFVGRVIESETARRAHAATARTAAAAAAVETAEGG